MRRSIQSIEVGDCFNFFKNENREGEVNKAISLANTYEFRVLKFESELVFKFCRTRWLLIEIWLLSNIGMVSMLLELELTNALSSIEDELLYIYILENQ